MTKYRLAEQCALIINGGMPQPDAPVQVQDLLLAVSQAMATVIKATYLQNLQETRAIDGSLIYTYKVALEKDCDRNKVFFTMPSTYLGSLPHEIGVYNVAFLKHEDNFWVNIGNSGLGMLAGLQFSAMGGRAQFWIESNRAYTSLPISSEGETVLIKLVAAYDGLPMDTPLNIPADIEAMIIQQVLAIYREQQDRPQDTTDDNQKLANTGAAK
jgi:hypothetical protein